MVNSNITLLHQKQQRISSDSFYKNNYATITFSNQLLIKKPRYNSSLKSHADLLLKQAQSFCLGKAIQSLHSNTLQF